MSLWREQFEGGAVAVREARHAVREHLDGELPPEQLSDIELLVSELASNSVRHGHRGEGRLSMETDVSDDRVRLRVWDNGPGFEEPGAPVPHSNGEGGYGLVLLDRLSDSWGVKRNGGFCVWFEVRRS
jgi:serine/threonine-protein kinase RsbW